MFTPDELITLFGPAACWVAVGIILFSLSANAIVKLKSKRSRSKAFFFGILLLALGFIAYGAEQGVRRLSEYRNDEIIRACSESSECFLYAMIGVEEGNGSQKVFHGRNGFTSRDRGRFTACRGETQQVDAYKLRSSVSAYVFEGLPPTKKAARWLGQCVTGNRECERVLLLRGKAVLPFWCDVRAASADRREVFVNFQLKKEIEREK